MSEQPWEDHAKQLFERLNEKHRRWVAGLLSEMLGRGGTTKIAQATGIDPKTIRQGRADLQQGLEAYPPGRVRRPGAGRPARKKTESDDRRDDGHQPGADPKITSSHAAS